jgi:hypothetical protein
MALRDGDRMYFYELHEGDDEVFSDVLLAHDSEYDENEFLELVLEARAAVLDKYEEDTLSEAIAHELEKRHGFLAIDDSQLRASVSVSATDDETVMVPVQAISSPGMKMGEDNDFRSLVLDVEPDDAMWGTD